MTRSINFSRLRIALPFPRFAVPRLALALLALAMLSAACTNSDDSTTATATATRAASALPDATVVPAPVAAIGDSEYPFTIVDSSDTEVEISTAPARVISYSPAATEILFAIGAGDLVVAADQFSDFPAATADLPKLKYSNPSPEAALAHDPDLVLMVTQQQQQVQQYRDLGMTVLSLTEAASLDGVIEDVRLLGRITDTNEQAEALADEMQQSIDAIAAAIADVDEGPRVFFELTTDLYSVGENTFVGGMISLLKGRNVAAGSTSDFPQLSAEAVIVADPEVVLLADAAFGGDPESVAARPGWDIVSAVVNDRLFAVDPDLTTRPGPRIVQGLAELARALYPDRFE